MDTDGTSALANSVWRGSREQLDSIVIRAADWLTKWSEFPLATAMLYSRLALVTWGQRGAPAFGVVATVDHALTLRRAWNAFLQDASNDELPLCLEAGLIEELGLVGKATGWHTDDVRVNIVTLPEGRMQGALYPGSRIVEHNGLRFRSHTEVRVAHALDDMGVMYFPLPVAMRRRVGKEPDFLILHKGMVGHLGSRWSDSHSDDESARGRSRRLVLSVRCHASPSLLGRRD